MTATTNPKLGLAALALCALLCAAAPAPANVYVVRNTTDSNDGTCDGHCSLREAIVAANAHPGMDYVTLPAGRFTLTIAGTGENACATGDLDITDSLAVSGQSPAESVVDAAGLGDRVFHVRAEGLTVLLSGLTVTGASISFNGAGAYHEAGHLILSNVALRDNHSAGHGGGVYAVQAELTVKDGSVISDNSAGSEWPYEGGGLCAGNLTVTDSTISGNQAHEGGGIASDAAGGNLTVSGSTIAYNGALSGGGILARWVELDVSNTTVVGNFGPNGGGIYLEHGSGTPTLNGVTLSGNSGNGSAVQVALSSISFTNTLVSGDCFSTLGGTLLSNGGNLESPGNTCTLTDPTDHVNVADPLLARLAPYGGPTRTLLPRLGSPAIGLGSNNYCLALDQRGEARSDGACDVGAVERQPADQDPLFVDGFETGDGGLWSASSP